MRNSRNCSPAGFAVSLNFLLIILVFVPFAGPTVEGGPGGRTVYAKSDSRAGATSFRILNPGAGLHIPPNFDLQAELLAADDGSNFKQTGFSIAVSGDTAVVGAPSDWNANGVLAGAVYVFVKSGVGSQAVWTQQAKIVPSGVTAGDYFGYSVDIDGDTLVAGAQGDDGAGGIDQGSAYVFVRSGSVWREQGRIEANDAGAADYFGFSVSVDGDTAAVGAPYWDFAGDQNQGAVYVFTRTGAVWTQQQKITSPESPLSTWFGSSVSVSGESLLIGSPLDYISNRANQGSAYVYTRTSGTWSQQARLIAANGAEGDRLGTSVSIDADTAVIGAPRRDIGDGQDEGAVYVFKRNGSFWSPQAYLISDDPNNNDWFGFSVSVAGDALIAGVPGDYTLLNFEQGSVFIFTRSSGVWSQFANLYASDGQSGNRLGTSAAISGDNAVAGAPYGLNGHHYGSAYAFFPSCGFTFDPPSQSFGAAGGGGSFQLTTATGCVWQAVSGSNWISVTGGSAGTGPGTVTYTVDPNPGIARTGSINAGGAAFLIDQGSDCVFSLTPEAFDFGPSGGSGAFTVTANDQSCVWSVVSDDSWITVTGGGGTGDGAVNFDVGPNAGPARTGTITAAGLTFTANQGSNCAYSLTASGTDAPAAGGSSSVGVVTSSLCPWTATSNASWITLTGGISGTGNGSVSFSIAPTPGASRSGTITAAGRTYLVRQLSLNGRLFDPSFDFDGDQATDVSVFRPGPADSGGKGMPEGSGAEWWLLNSADQSVLGAAFGNAQDIPAPGDFTGDGKTDIAFFRPSTSEWFVLRSEDFTFFAFPFGSSGDIPAPGDFDGDGTTDPAVYRPSIGTWFVIRSSDSGVSSIPFGISEDRPAVGDFDGDGIDDISIYRPSVSQWWQLRSSAGAIGYQFGAPGDLPVPGDFTGDGKTDAAFFRPLTGEWFILRSEDASYFAFPWGVSGDIPSPGDFDGDGRSDPVVFRPSQGIWFIFGSTSGFRAVYFGSVGDIPIPGLGR